MSAPRPRRILVPLDGSSLAARSVDHAGALADALEAGVILFTVMNGDEGQGALRDFSVGEGISLDEAVESYLSRVARSMPEGVDVETRSRFHEQPATAIVDLAREEGIDLIVMASHGRSGVGRWLLGSVADKVLQSSTVPVLVVPVRDLS